MTVVKRITKISDKLEKVSDNFTVYRYDNGYGIDIGGRDKEGEWTSCKIVCTNLDDLFAIIKEATTLTLD